MSQQVRCKRRYDHATLQQAVDAIRGKALSIRAASRAYNIPRATLYDKINNRRPMEAGSRTVLSRDEERQLVDWTVHMARIGYGRTRGEVLDSVKRILDIDGRINPFKNNRPGKDWWYAFVKRHPELSERLPQELGKERAIITPEKVTRWFDDFKRYIEEEVRDPSILLEPSRLYNADESGFSLCPKSGKVLAKRGSGHVYSFSASDKTQITVLACMGATGHFLRPLIVYPGQRFSYNPLEDYPEAMMGRSENGWMDSDLFYTWVKDLFLPAIEERRVKKPVVLFVDGHSTHMSLRVSDLCRKNGVEVYCLLEHASHLMQPCDIRLFSNMKNAWRQAVRDFQYENIGEHVTKRTFAKIFKDAWDRSTTVAVAVNGFREAGLFPLDPTRILKTAKLCPSQIFSAPKETSCVAESSIPQPVEVTSQPSQTEKPSDCVAESSIPQPVEVTPQPSPSLTEKPSDCVAESSIPQPVEVTPQLSLNSTEKPSEPEEKTQENAFSQVLKLPVVPQNKTKTKRVPLPKAVTGERFRQIIEEKQRKREEEEQKKKARKLEREMKKVQREEEKLKKQKIREEKKKEREEKKKQVEIERKLKALEKKRKRNDSSSSDDDGDDMPQLSDGSGSALDSDDDINTCTICGEAFDASPFWVKCTKCQRVFHRYCVKTIDLCLLSEEEIEDLQFECDYC